MICEFVTRSGSQSLALFFTGWGMDCNPFRRLSVGCDLAVVYDYSCLEIDATPLLGYHNIYLFAWSFGVAAAAHFVQSQSRLPIVFKMAINGTQFPIDDHRGIPRKLFEATRDSLTDRSLSKFYRRMCGSSQLFDDFIAHRPQRTVQSLYDELVAIDALPGSPIVWDKAVASSADLIFPFENQLNGWAQWCTSLEIEDNGAHYPADFTTLIGKNIIDKQLVRQRFSKSMNDGYDRHAFIQRRIAQRLFDQWKQTIGITPGASILEIGCGTGFLTRLYTPGTYPARLVLNDLCRAPQVTLNLNDTQYEFIEGDAEQIDFPRCSFDYVVSSSAIQWLENLPQFLASVHRWLRPGGAMVLSTFGPDNMREIGQDIKISLNYKSTNWFYNEISSTFDIVFVSEEPEIVLFASPTEVLRHIQQTGVNSINSRHTPRSAIRHLLASYPQVEGKSPLTYDPIYIIATKKDD